MRWFDVGCGVFFNTNNRRKSNPSLHQKQMRFFTVFFLVLVFVLFGVLLWLVNRSGDIPH